MPNPQLSAVQLRLANQLLVEIRRQLDELCQGDPELRFALNRKLAKELTYDERGKPGHRRRLKLLKRTEQNGKCAVCPADLPTRGAILDRFEAVKGYTADNTRLICDSCDRAIQEERGFR